MQPLVADISSAYSAASHHGSLGEAEDDDAFDEEQSVAGSLFESEVGVPQVDRNARVHAKHECRYCDLYQYDNVDAVCPFLPTAGPNKMWASPGELDGPHPHRAICLNVAMSVLQPGATSMNQMKLDERATAYTTAVAALLSLVFAGTSMGLPQGEHEEDTRNVVAEEDAEGEDGTQSERGSAGGGRSRPKSKKQKFAAKERYSYVPKKDSKESWPMFQIGFEEVYDEHKSGVVAVRIWKFVRTQKDIRTHAPRTPPMLPHACMPRICPRVRADIRCHVFNLRIDGRGNEAHLQTAQKHSCDGKHSDWTRQQAVQ